MTVAAAGVAPCGERNFGEVVAVASDVHTFPSTVSNRTSHPEPLACQPTARRYLGWDVAADELSVGEWSSPGSAAGSGVGAGARSMATGIDDVDRAVRPEPVAVPVGAALVGLRSATQGRSIRRIGSGRAGRPRLQRLRLVLEPGRFRPARDGGLQPSTHG